MKKMFLEILQDIYNRRKNFKEFIKKSYFLLKKHEKQIKEDFETL